LDRHTRQIYSFEHHGNINGFHSESFTIFDPLNK
jgi:hypothetical protein